MFLAVMLSIMGCYLASPNFTIRIKQKETFFFFCLSMLLFLSWNFPYKYLRLYFGKCNNSFFEFILPFISICKFVVFSFFFLFKAFTCFHFISFSFARSLTQLNFVRECVMRLFIVKVLFFSFPFSLIHVPHFILFFFFL